MTQAHIVFAEDDANLAELSRYFPLPVQMARGEGALQAWFEFDDGQPVAVCNTGTDGERAA